MRGETGPAFIEALARGLDVIHAFEPKHPTLTRHGHWDVTKRN